MPRVDSLWFCLIQALKMAVALLSLFFFFFTSLWKYNAFPLIMFAKLDAILQLVQGLCGSMGYER